MASLNSEMKLKLTLDEEGRELLTLLRMLRSGELATKSLVEQVAAEREQLRSALVALLETSADFIGSVATADHLRAREAAVKLVERR